VKECLLSHVIVDAMQASILKKHNKGCSPHVSRILRSHERKETTHEIGCLGNGQGRP
jgi:hypothetical protein